MPDRDIARAHADEVIELDVEQSTKMLKQARELFESAEGRFAASVVLYLKARRLARWAFVLAVLAGIELATRWL